MTARTTEQRAPRSGADHRLDAVGVDADIGGGLVSLPEDPIVIRLGGSLDDPQFVDRDGSWGRWLRAAARDAILQKATEGGLSDLLRRLKKD